MRRAGPRGFGKPGKLSRASPKIERFGVPHDRHHEARRGLRRDTDVNAGVLMQDAGRVVEKRIHHRVILDGAHEGAHEEGEESEPRPVFALFLVE